MENAFYKCHKISQSKKEKIRILKVKLICLFNSKISNSSVIGKYNLKSLIGVSKNAMSFFLIHLST